MTYRAVEVVGVEDAVKMLNETTLLLEDMRSAQPVINQILASHYVRKWRDWAGYLYDTGRLAASWTTPQLTSGGDAIRQAHQQSIEYGSSVWYGRFHAGKILGDVKAEAIDVTEAMADYYAGVRVIGSYMRGGSRVRAHLRQTHS